MPVGDTDCSVASGVNAARMLAVSRAHGVKEFGDDGVRGIVLRRLRTQRRDADQSEDDSECAKSRTHAV